MAEDSDSMAKLNETFKNAGFDDPKNIDIKKMSPDQVELNSAKIDESAARDKLETFHKNFSDGEIMDEDDMKKQNDLAKNYGESKAKTDLAQSKIDMNDAQVELIKKFDDPNKADAFQARGVVLSGIVQRKKTQH